MQNLNPNSAQVASAPLITETVRPQPAAPVAAAPAVQRAESLSTGEQVKLDSYTVKRGDTLWDIAGVKLGDNKKWPLLFALNKDQIKNPDLIYPGQVLTIPQKVEVAPPAPPTAIPSPVDPTPPPLQEEPVPVPAQPAPAQPAPVQEVPVAPPVAPEPPVLKPPSELPEPAPDPVPATPAPVQEEPVMPVPTAPAPPVEPVPPLPPGSVIGQPPVAENKGNGVGKAALIGGTVATVATGAVLIGVTKSLAPPLSNLGGYATAQVVAKSVNGVIGKVGLKLPTGPALTKIVSKVGGPKSAGVVTALAVGAVVAGV
ncbi:MAG: LysM peptidoglycan-binding domain-containing protein, partial [Candidatus Sericytochromatia bacterium]